MTIVQNISIFFFADRKRLVFRSDRGSLTALMAHGQVLQSIQAIVVVLVRVAVESDM